MLFSIGGGEDHTAAGIFALKFPGSLQVRPGKQQRIVGVSVTHTALGKQDLTAQNGNIAGLLGAQGRAGTAVDAVGTVPDNVAALGVDILCVPADGRDDNVLIAVTIHIADCGSHGQRHIQRQHTLQFLSVGRPEHELFAGGQGKAVSAIPYHRLQQTWGGFLAFHITLNGFFFFRLENIFCRQFRKDGAAVQLDTVGAAPVDRGFRLVFAADDQVIVAVSVQISCGD